MNYINNFASNIGSYFFKTSAQTEEQDPLILMEEGALNLSIQTQNPIGTVLFPSSIINEARKTRMKDADPEARAAAGDASKFVPRFKSLLEEQYQDKDGQTRTVIGIAINTILDKAENKKGIASIIDPDTANDVDLLISPREKTAIVAMDRTTTKMGSAYFQRAIARPSADLETILGYQTVIRFLTKEAAIFDDLAAQLQTMCPGEINLISCQDTRKQLPGSTTSLYYTISPRVNEALNMSSLALDISAFGATIKKATNAGMQAFAGIALPLYAASQISSTFGGPRSPEMLQGFANRFTASTPVGVLGGLAMTLNISPLNALVASAAGAYSLLSVQSTYDWFIADSSIVPLMRDILSSIATHYKGMKAIHALLKTHPEITEKLKHFQKLDNFINNSKNSPELGSLLNALESFTFNPNNKFCFRPGEVLVVWELLHSGGGKKAKGKPDQAPPAAAGDKIRAEIEQALLAIGEIDTFLSIATLLRESESSHQKYCLPTFTIGDQEPSLHLSGLWHPGIGKNAVANELHLGKGAPSKGMIISGPNTGGKSCFAQAATLATITSRMGFCAAKEATLSNFGYIRTSMKIEGSVDAAESLFAAQCARLAAIDTDVPKNTHSFIALDEPCSQTNATQGSAIAIALAKKLSTIAGNITMVITHYRNVAEEIGDKDTLSYKNYKMIGNGAFKLEEGISEEAANNAFAVAEKFGLSKETLNIT